MVTLHLFSVIPCSAESLFSGCDTCTPYTLRQVFFPRIFLQILLSGLQENSRYDFCKSVAIILQQKLPQWNRTGRLASAVLKCSAYYAVKQWFQIGGAVRFRR
jgi:hypothetical protein